MRVDPNKLKSVELIDQTDSLIVVNKPNGIAVHGGAGQTGQTLIEIIRAASDEPDSIHPIHRLDRATSGLVLFSKHQRGAKEYSAIWPSIQKTYFALVFGHWTGPNTIERKLDGKPATTKILQATALSSPEPYSVLRLRLVTGRTHQIRRHLSDLGYPLVMDDKYGDFKANKLFRRSLQEKQLTASRKALFLHAGGLDIPAENQSWTVVPPENWFRNLAALSSSDMNLLLNPNVV